MKIEKTSKKHTTLEKRKKHLRILQNFQESGTPIPNILKVTANFNNSKKSTKKDNVIHSNSAGNSKAEGECNGMSRSLEGADSGTGEFQGKSNGAIFPWYGRSQFSGDFENVNKGRDQFQGGLHDEDIGRHAIRDEYKSRDRRGRLRKRNRSKRHIPKSSKSFPKSSKSFRESTWLFPKNTRLKYKPIKFIKVSVTQNGQETFCREDDVQSSSQSKSEESVCRLNEVQSSYQTNSKESICSKDEVQSNSRSKSEIYGMSKLDLFKIGFKKEDVENYWRPGRNARVKKILKERYENFHLVEHFFECVSPDDFSDKTQEINGWTLPQKLILLQKIATFVVPEITEKNPEMVWKKVELAKSGSWETWQAIINRLHPTMEEALKQVKVYISAHLEDSNNLMWSPASLSGNSLQYKLEAVRKEILNVLNDSIVEPHWVYQALSVLGKLIINVQAIDTQFNDHVKRFDKIVVDNVS